MIYLIGFVVGLVVVLGIWAMDKSFYNEPHYTPKRWR